ncbi:hypothetical protein H109_06633 [Trichophyton interdigitale MR816]|uniref:Uncharacterized protein n=1 Tax=Trichophyton interdigitale (strain MR816) TaxID=1215338 RepID=A0A059J0T2_TRIIM|nr:hypothetical protein H109_06633 [Trichophyton interdigitale MR816]
MPVPLGPESKKKDKSTVGPNGKSNMNDPLSTPNTTITMTTTAETTTNVPPTASGTGPGVMTQEEVDRLYEERMEEEFNYGNTHWGSLTLLWRIEMSLFSFCAVVCL